MNTPFRFGVNLLALTPTATEDPADPDGWAAKSRHAEELGFDVLLVPDHLGAPAPFPAVVAAAAATTRPRVGTFVLNAAFWNPVLLAREIATVDRLTGGRFELGLGTGYVQAEFDAAGVAWGTPGQRVDRLARLVTGLDDAFAAAGLAPLQQPRPPLLLGGHGNRLLSLAAEHADVVALAAAALEPGSTSGRLRLVDADTLEERVRFVTARAGARAAGLETNVLVQAVVVTPDRRAAVADLAARYGVDYLGVDQLLEVPTLLVGTVPQIADQLRAHRERFGISYVTVLEPSMEAMAPVIAELSGS